MVDRFLRWINLEPKLIRALRHVPRLCHHLFRVIERTVKRPSPE